MADLEALNNDQLRAKLVEHGLGNMPVTNTTRKVLISKLQKVINGEVVVAPKNSRRETIHVAKPTVEEQKKNVEQKKRHDNRRATISAQPPPDLVVQPAAAAVAAPAPAVVVAAAPVIKGPIENSRRSGRITPSKPFVEHLTITAPITIAEEDSDDDVILVPSVKPIERNTKSRSPSLSKSDTVTTSYNRVLSKPTTEQISEELDSSDAEIQEYMASKPSAQYKYEQYESKNRTPEKPIIAHDDGARRRVTLNYRDSPSRPTISTSYNYYETPDKRRQTVSSLSSKLSTDNMNTVEEIADKQNTPYLSDFARRLSRLKAEPLLATTTKPINNFDSESDEDRPHYTYASSMSQKRMAHEHHELQPQQSSAWGKFQRILLFIILFLLAIFIYIMFFTNN